MRMSFLLMLVLICATLGNAQSKNYKIGEDELQPSIDINLKNPKNITVATAADKVHYSLDGGNSWLDGKVKSPSRDAKNPVIRSNVHGMTFLVQTIESEVNGKKEYAVISKTSRSGGKSWLPEMIVSSSPKKKDRPQLVIHPKKSKMGIVWTEADSFESLDPACHSVIMYSESSSGEKWSIPVQLNQGEGDCGGKENTLHDPSLAMDDDHKVFVTWEAQGNIVMDRSYDAAQTWLNNDMAGFRQSATRGYSIPGINYVDRAPNLIADNSHSLFQNSMYMAWADQRNGENDTDIYFATTVRRGDSWTMPIKVNGDPKGKHQFMPAITVDVTTGVIYIVYYDRRNYTDDQTDVYLAWSTDGGTKFSELKISETPFIPTKEIPFTSYIGISAVDGLIAPVWVRMDEGKTSVWTTVIKQQDIIQPEQLPRIKVAQKQGSYNSQPKPVQQQRSLRPRQ